MTLSTPKAATIANETRPKGDISVLFCGGTGCDIAAKFTQKLKQVSTEDQAALANIHAGIIDTSRSNLNENHAGLALYILKANGKEMDGGGKDMMGAYKGTKQQFEDIYLAMKPQKTTLLICNMGGGSGGAIASQMAQGLLERGHDVIVLGIVAVESRVVQENSTRTLALMQRASTDSNRTLVLSPFLAGKTNTFEGINTMISDYAFMLSVLYSNQNKRLDSSDLHNWVNYEKTLKMQPALMGSYITVGDSALPEEVTPFTVATLTTDEEQDAAPGWTPDYQAHGILPIKPNFAMATPVHFVVATGVVEQINNRINESVAALQREAAQRQVPKPLAAPAASMEGFD